MTRRLAIAILLTVWTTLVAGGVVAWATTRVVLLSDLDDAMILAAENLPEVAGARGSTVLAREARYFVTDDTGHRFATPTVTTDTPRTYAGPQPDVKSRSFVRLGDGRRYRNLTIRFPAHDDAVTGSASSQKMLTIVYSQPADRFDAMLQRLTWMLITFGGVAGLAAAGVAIYLARSALRPLRETAAVVGEIDERRLDRRIDRAALPPELQPTADRLNEMLARLERAFAQQQQFLADASHELRTPVAALVTTLEVSLRRPREAAELTEALRTSLGEARFLRRLVQALLEHARAERAGRSPDAARATAEAIDVHALLDECCAVVLPLAQRVDVRLIKSIQPIEPIQADFARLAGAVINLLSNAVEYNRRGGEVELGAFASEGCLRISVRDTGPGIPPAQLANLFQPFSRAGVPQKGPGRAVDDSPGDLSDQHLGLGLFIVRSNAIALGGDVEVSSAVGAGTTFILRIPVVTPVKRSVASKHPQRPAVMEHREAVAQ